MHLEESSLRVPVRGLRHPVGRVLLEEERARRPVSREGRRERALQLSQERDAHREERERLS
jgi:hypothetical protein